MEPRLRLEKFPPQAGINPRPLDQLARAQPTELPGLLFLFELHPFYINQSVIILLISNS